MKDPFQLVGTTVAEKYRVDRVLNEGGFGVVYQGFHLIVGEKVAIKCMKVFGASTHESQRTSEAFLREARALFSLNHPAIVRMYDVGALAMPLGSVPYVVLEYVEGLSLEQDLERRVRRQAPYNASELLLIFEPVLEALAFAHERGVVHRDLKPSNVMLMRPGEPTMSAKVLDFGMARTGSGAVTKGAPGFTPGYAAPEQWDPALGRAGAPCDTFALGLLLAEACTLQQVFRGQGVADIYRATMAGLLDLGLAARRPDLPLELERVIVRATRTAPSERYANARELLEAVRAAFGQTLSRPPPALDVIVAPTLRAAGNDPPPQERPLAPAPLPSAPLPSAPPPSPAAMTADAPRPLPAARAITPQRAPTLAAPSIAPLLVGLFALVVAMGALAVVGALLLGQRRKGGPAPAPLPSAVPESTSEPSEPLPTDSTSGSPARDGDEPVAPARPGSVRTSRVVGAGLGPGEADVARRGVEAHMGEVQACYRTALAQKPALKGEVGLMLEVGTKGEVASVLFGGGEAPSLDPTLTRCLKSRIEAWRFPELKEKHFIYVLAFGA